MQRCLLLGSQYFLHTFELMVDEWLRSKLSLVEVCDIMIRPPSTSGVGAVDDNLERPIVRRMLTCLLVYIGEYRLHVNGFDDNQVIDVLRCK